MSLAVPRCALYEGRPIGDARPLRRLWDTVDVSTQRDDGRTRAPGGHPGRGDAGHASFDLEPVLFEDLRDIPLGLVLLEAELREAEDAVNHLLGEVSTALDVDGDFVLECLEARIWRESRSLRTGPGGATHKQQDATRERQRGHGGTHGCLSHRDLRSVERT